jgi:hypothetical protein
MSSEVYVTGGSAWPLAAVVLYLGGWHLVAILVGMGFLLVLLMLVIANLPER